MYTVWFTAWFLPMPGGFGSLTSRERSIHPGVFVPGSLGFFQFDLASICWAPRSTHPGFLLWVLSDFSSLNLVSICWAPRDVCAWGMGLAPFFAVRYTERCRLGSGIDKWDGNWTHTHTHTPMIFSRRIHSTPHGLMNFTSIDSYCCCGGP